MDWQKFRVRLLSLLRLPTVSYDTPPGQLFFEYASFVHFKSTPIRHIFTYARTPDLLDVEDQKLSKLVKVLLGIVGAMALLIAIVGILYTNSERAKLLENTYPVGRLPKDYKKSPTRIRKQIRQYEDILEQRQKDIKK